jgi:hypothetical protein
MNKTSRCDLRYILGIEVKINTPYRMMLPKKSKFIVKILQIRNLMLSSIFLRGRSAKKIKLSIRIVM